MHIMIDLETLSLRPDARIIQIAAVEFEPRHGGKIMVDRAYCATVSADNQEERHTSVSTLAFWAEETRKGSHILSNSLSGGSSLSATLIGLRNWLVVATPVEGVWSHGAAFDLPILTHAYLAARLEEPWNYRLARDTRTYVYARGFHPPTEEERIYFETKASRILGQPFIKHHALHDCVLQCCQLQAVMP